MKLKNLLNPTWEQAKKLQLLGWQLGFLILITLGLIMIMIGFGRELLARLLDLIESAKR